MLIDICPGQTHSASVCRKLLKKWQTKPLAAGAYRTPSALDHVRGRRLPAMPQRALPTQLDILLPGMTPAERFSALVHELAHEMPHRDRRSSETTQRVRETEAEAVVFVVSQGIGLDTNTAAQDYISLYSGDAELLLESLEYIQQTASHILNSIGAENSSAPPAN